MDTQTPDPQRTRLGLLATAFILLFGISAFMAIDPVKAPLGIRGDEATYVAMALSAAFDFDLAYEKQDLERFWGYYQCGPEGVFLKQGKQVDLSLTSSWPYVRMIKSPDPRADRLYFGKAYTYPVAVAPFVRLAGLRGIYFLHVILLAACFLSAYSFLAARSPGVPSLLLASAFFGASMIPAYIVRFYSDYFIFAVIFLGSFLWLYKEVAPPAEGLWARFLRSPLSDFAAVVLFGIATYSKPLFILMAAPPVLACWFRRRFRTGFMLGVAYVATVLLLFGLNGAITGELNYQGGYRKTFYVQHPFEAPHLNFETCGASVTTNKVGGDADAHQSDTAFLNHLRLNSYYFFVGRHAGLIPYFFPAAVILTLYLFAPGRLTSYRILALAAVAGTQLFSMMWMPHNWAGGGGQPGNRYFMGAYPLLLFLTPPIRSVAPGLLAWAGGALFAGHLLLNPFISSAWPWTIGWAKPLRIFPVELTMPNDLPIMLDPIRSKIRYNSPPGFTMRLLDEYASGPEGEGIWIRGGARGDVFLRSAVEVPALKMTITSLIENTVTVRAGGPKVTVELAANTPVTVEIGRAHV